MGSVVVIMFDPIRSLHLNYCKTYKCGFTFVLDSQGFPNFPYFPTLSQWLFGVYCCCHDLLQGPHRCLDFAKCCLRIAWQQCRHVAPSTTSARAALATAVLQSLQNVSNTRSQTGGNKPRSGLLNPPPPARGMN